MHTQTHTAKLFNSLTFSKYKYTSIPVLLTGSDELKSSHIPLLPKSIFSDLTFKWRPEQYIACLSLSRPCLQNKTSRQRGSGTMPG